jgi:hypothetical protein
MISRNFVKGDTWPDKLPSLVAQRVKVEKGVALDMLTRLFIEDCQFPGFGFQVSGFLFIQNEALRIQHHVAFRPAQYKTRLLKSVMILSYGQGKECRYCNFGFGSNQKKE